MNISFNPQTKVFSLETENSGYYIGIVDDEQFVSHIHFGKKLGNGDELTHLLRIHEHPRLPGVNNRDRLAIYDSLRWEYPTGGVGDFRESCLDVKNELGQSACSLHYEGYGIIRGKPLLEGLPCLWSSEGSDAAGGTGSTDAMTLVLTLRDDVLGLEVKLNYSLFAGIDAVVRSACITNCSGVPLTLTKALSACLDMDNDGFDFISLHGAWARERHIDRSPLFHGKMSVSSTRGETSHQHNNFAAVVGRNTDWNCGDAYGMSLVYSGNFITQAQVDQYDSVRAVTGINPEHFEWVLAAGESFVTPEAVLVYSPEGLNGMSRNFHNLWREHLIRSRYAGKMRPVLINNWEATYFDFDTEKLLGIAREAHERGIEMLVMDDGWFGKRSNDESSLGDWQVNEEKLKGGLPHLVQEVNRIGMKFGIWFEPEMISPDSDLYRSHPDWALGVKDRTRTMSRCQYVLDLTRKDVCDYVYDSVAKILHSANIEYVKWDMNRQLTDAGSVILGAEHSGELFHRYVLAVYALQERLVKEFPDLLLENCSGGGGRFDPGMLYYSPQIWCSDNTDSIERLAIQEGTALVYPLSAMGAHVSVCPNHTVGRTTPFRTRGFVALSGTFGYELDVTKLSPEEKALIPEQIAMYKKFSLLVQNGDYWRLESYAHGDWQYGSQGTSQNRDRDAWQVVSKNKSESLVTVVQVLNHASVRSKRLVLKGLMPGAAYTVSMEDSTGTKTGLGIWTAETLENWGLVVPHLWGDFASAVIHLKRV